MIRRGILAACCGAMEMKDNAVLQVFCFPPEFVGFAGHFPDQPILPAVVQIGMGMLLAQALLHESEDALVLGSVGKAKFVRIIEPGQRVVAQCIRQVLAGRRFEVRLSVEQTAASSFTLEYVLSGKGQIRA